MTGDIPYFKIRKGRGYFELGKDRAARVGMKASYPLGSDINSAKKSALDLHDEWLKKSGRPTLQPVKKIYKRGTVGHLYARFQLSEKWRRKKPATVKDWQDHWPFIDEHLGHVQIDKVTPTMFEQFHMTMEREYGTDKRWRIVKIARALFNDAVKRQFIKSSPCMLLSIITNLWPLPCALHGKH